MASPAPHVAFAPTDLRASLRQILRPSQRAEAIIDEMLLAKGSIGPAGLVARRLGFRNRFDLAAWFTRQGLPPLHELAGWISVLSWLERWETAGVALCAGALREDRDPGACYRLVQRITGMTWGEVKEAGLSGMLSCFAERCRIRRRRWLRPARTSGPQPASATGYRDAWSRNAAKAPLSAAKTP
jgi:hypothetical protein